MIFIILVIFFLIELVLVFKVLEYIEKRSGIVLNDPVLKLIPSFNVSKILFFLTYTGSIVGIILVLRKPDLFVLTLISYSLLLFFRFFFMYLTPLDPPLEIIPLRDWVLELTFYRGEPNLKDLFFSGHTATMVMFYFIHQKTKFRYLFLSYSFLIGIFVLIQHAHYTIDVVVAPFMAFVSYILAKNILKYIKFENH